MQRRKRLLVVANRFYPQVGGAELVTWFQTVELGKHLDVDVITPVRDRNPRRETVEGIRILRAYNLRNPWNRFPYLDAFTLCPGVASGILTGTYDLVHCFPAINRNNRLAVAAARLRGTPVFLTSYDAFDYSAVVNREGFEPGDLDRLTFSESAKRQFERFSAIFTISERETRLLKAVNPNTFLSTVPVRLDEFDPPPDIAGFRKKLNIPEGVRIVLSLSRVSHIKGQDILLAAIPHLRERTRDFVVVIAGRTDYEPEFHRELQDYVREHGLGGVVLFTGSLSREDALAALAGCAVHVLPMRFMNSGAVVVETWASRRPVIQSNRVDPNYVVEGENGFTFDVGDPAGLAARITEILDDPGRADRMGVNGRKLVETRFLYSHLAAQYLEVYRRSGAL